MRKELRYHMNFVDAGALRKYYIHSRRQPNRLKRSSLLNVNRQYSYRANNIVDCSNRKLLTKCLY
uniref:Uncharacterized protein n=1 Tax=Parascaris equorum TaxID=6256 RepID=A0A914RZQ5_PAREQ